ncbi:M42 family metallopeptidase [Candidatus Bathyarchaeota archaeon]|nr:M42 family metallopeptidase [Candidatus Bathyarchaeota archaeon]
MLDDWSLKVLKDLSESFGPAGFEREVAQKVKRYMKEYADEILTDKLGSVIFVKKGASDRPRVLLPGHIDEVGFVVSGIDDLGYVTFNPLGGWFDQVLLSQRVVIRTRKGDVYGVIAAKPPHLLTPEEAKKVVEKKNMFIDVGATSRKEAEEMGIRIGDPVVPYSPFMTVRDGKIAMGKAFDDRVGAFVAMAVVRRLKTENIQHPNTVYGAGTVQEEVGLRGAGTVAHVVDPDVAIVLEVDIAGDVPGIKATEAPAKLGKGPSIVTYDASMIPNQPLKEFVIEVAEKTGIPYQLSQVARGGTDAGRIHISRAGCPSIVIGVPTRHIHTHVGLFSLEDLENTVKLVVELVKRLDKKTVESFTAL